jgi:hypothetical protein
MVLSTAVVVIAVIPAALGVPFAPWLRRRLPSIVVSVMSRSSSALGIIVIMGAPGVMARCRTAARTPLARWSPVGSERIAETIGRGELVRARSDGSRRRRVVTAVPEILGDVESWRRCGVPVGYRDGRFPCRRLGFGLGRRLRAGGRRRRRRRLAGRLE